MKIMICTSLLLGMMACTGSSRDSLVDNHQWVFDSTQSDDPFSSETNASTNCPEDAYGTEEEGSQTWFSLETEECPYLTVKQELDHAVAEGSDITINVFHFALTAPASTQAHIALAFGSQVAWETNVPIPSDSASIVETFAAPSDLEAGSPVFFHIHNHGTNSYALVELFEGRP